MTRKLLLSVALIAVLVAGYTGLVMSASDEHMSMLLRRAARAETISSDIALRLAEMLFVHHHGKDVTDAQLPLVIIDHGDRWEVLGGKAVPPGQRLKIVIMKVDARIAEFVIW